jgi:hypothetical protein
MKLISVIAMLFLAACGTRDGRYQIIPNTGGSVWRIDTRTGSLEACGFEKSTPICHQFPDPRKN